MAMGLWMLGILLATVLLNILTLLAAYRLGSVVVAGSAPGGDVASTAVDGTVSCTDCGTENGAEYRYCRACVAELPGAGPLERGTETPVGGLVR